MIPAFLFLNEKANKISLNRKFSRCQMSRAGRSLRSYLLSIAIAVLSFVCFNFLVASDTWASLGVDPKWFVAVKLGLALVVFLIFKGLTRPRQP